MHLLIGTPLRLGCAAEYLNGLLPVIRGALPDHEIEFCALGGPQLPLIRNEFAYKAVSENFDGLLQIDDDLQWQPKHVARILGHGLDVVSGLYCKRKPGVPEWLFRPKTGASVKDGVIECSVVPTGFLFASTKALKKIFDDNPQLHYEYKEDSSEKMATRCEWFPMGVINGRWLGEDYKFCQLARKSGFAVWQDVGGEIIRHGYGVGFPILETEVGLRAGEAFALPEPMDL